MSNRNSIGCLGLVLVVVVVWFLVRIASLQSEQVEAARAAQARAAAAATRPPAAAEAGRSTLVATQLRQAFDAHQQVARLRLRGGDGALEGTWTIKELGDDGAVLQSSGGDNARLVVRLDAVLAFVVLEPMPQLEQQVPGPPHIAVPRELDATRSVK